jgi:hypothetical protein
MKPTDQLATRRHRPRYELMGGKHAGWKIRRRLTLAEALEPRRLLSTVTGVVFNDVNGNGVQDAGEPPLAGWTVDLYFSDNPNRLQPPSETLVTDANGVYSSTDIPTGSFNATVDLPSGWISSGIWSSSYSSSYPESETQNFEVTSSSLVRGQVFADANGEGTRVPNQGGIGAGWNVYLDTNNNGVYDAGEPSAVTDQNGSYQIGALGAGDYTVRVAAQPGYQLTGNAASGVLVSFAATATAAAANFTVYNIHQASISGIVFDDFNGDGIQEYGEGFCFTSGISLIPVSTASPISAQWQWATNGGYSFGDLPAGTYIIRVSSRDSEWSRTTQPGVTDIPVTVNQNQAVAGPTIGGKPKQEPYPLLTGAVFDDTNGKQTPAPGRMVYLDEDENGSFGWVNGSVTLEDATVTDQNGQYYFGVAPTGRLVLRQVLPSGTVQSLPTPGGGIVVNAVAGQQIDGLDFASITGIAGAISGSLFNDQNRNGVRDSGEPLLITKTVFLDTNDNGVLDPGEPSELSDQLGNFNFSGLPVGTYHVRVVVPTNWLGTLPEADATLTAAKLSPSVLLGIHDLTQSATITGTVFEDANGDGLRSQFESGADFATAYVDLNNDGILDNNEPSATPTWYDGTFAIKAYNPGVPTTYTVRLSLPAGDVQTTPAANAPLMVTAGLNSTASVGTFGARKLQPVASAGGPYTVVEGGSVKLDGSASVSVNGQPLTFAWTFDYQPSSSAPPVDATGINPSFSAANLSSGTTRTILLTVTDTNGRTGTATTTLVVTAALPTATFSITGPVTPGSAATASFSNVHDTPGNLAAGFTYSYDFNDDGTYDLVTTASTATIPAKYLSTTGAHTIAGRITNKEGGYAAYTATVQVTPATSLVVTPPANQSTTVGVAKTFSLGSFTATFATAPYSIDVNWGDGSADTIFSQASTGAIKPQSHNFARAATDVVSVSVFDSLKHRSSAARFNVSVTSPSTPAAKLMIATQPTTGTAGVALSPVLKVNVLNSIGKLATGDTSSVTVSILSGPKGGTLTGTATAKVVNGVATFSGLSLKIAGVYTLKVTDGSLTSATLSKITISAAAANKLVFAQQPTAGTHGVALSPGIVVDVEDAFGNIVTTDSSTVKLTIVSGPSGGTVSGTLSVKAVKGIVTFGKLTLSKAGTYTFKATDGKLATVTSKSLLIR